MTPDDIKQRLEEAGKTLFLMRMPINGKPADYQSYWPDILRGGADLFAAQVSMDSDQRKEFAADHNRTRLHPTARQISQWEEAWQWLFLIDDRVIRQVTAARSLKYPATDRHVASLRSLAKKFHCNHEHIRALHYKGLCKISQELNKC